VAVAALANALQRSIGCDANDLLNERLAVTEDLRGEDLRPGKAATGRFLIERILSLPR
jgi:hypothetical protein